MTEISDYRRRQASLAGYKAHQQGKTREACNRQPGTIYFDDWNDGYGAAENEAWRARPTALAAEKTR